MAAWDQNQVDAAMHEEAWEAKASRQVQRKLADLRNALRNADSRWRIARMQTAPAQSLHVLRLYDDVPVGLGDEIVYVRPALPAPDHEDHFQVRMDRDRQLLLVTYVGSEAMFVRPQSGNVIAVGRSR